MLHMLTFLHSLGPPQKDPFASYTASPTALVMFASNGQVAYLGYDPKSDGTGEFLLTLFLFLVSFLFSVSIPFSAVISSFPFPVLFAFSQARLLISIPENRSRQCTESFCSHSLGPGLGPELELVAIAWYQCWCLCRGAGPSAWLPCLGPGGVVLQSTQVERTRYLCSSSSFIYIYHLGPINSSMLVALPLPFLKFLPCLLFLLFPFLALYHLASLLTPTPPLSFTNRWNMVDDLQDPHCIVWVTWQSYWWWRSKHRRVEYREWEWDVGALTTTTKAATVVLGLVGVGMAVLGVFVR